jgi:DHA1 family multidrug resistance protein-like MFS transporter
MRSFKDFGLLAPLYLAVFVVVLGFSLVVPFFPSYAMNLGASYTMLGFIVSIYGAVQLVTQIPIGRLSDRMGRKKMLLLGLITFSFLPPLYIYADNAYSLLFIRALGGVGASLVWPIAMALIVDQSRSQSRGAAMGLYNAAFFSALALGPFIGGVLFDQMGFEAPFYFWALLGTASVVIVYLKVEEPIKTEVQIGLLPQKGREPLIASGYRNTFLACCSVVLWSGVVGGFNFTMLPVYAAGLGLSTTDVGLIYLVYGGSTALSNIYFGRLADRGRRRLLIFTGCLAGLISFALLLGAETMVQVSILFAGMGLGLGMGGPAAAAIIADTTCTSRRGEIYGIFNTARMSGVVVGPLIAGLTAELHGVDGSIFVFTFLAAAITIGTLIIRESRGRMTCSAKYVDEA